MSTRPFLWGLAGGLACLSVISWLIASALKTGNVGMRSGLVFRDSNPVGFWIGIFVYVILDVLMLALTIKLIAVQFATS